MHCNHGGLALLARLIRHLNDATLIRASATQIGPVCHATGAQRYRVARSEERECRATASSTRIVEAGISAPLDLRCRVPDRRRG
jgi:hypothetical protein